MTNRRKIICPRESVATSGNCPAPVKTRAPSSKSAAVARTRVRRSVDGIRPGAAKITPGRKRRRSPGSEHPPATLMKKYFLNKMSTGKRLAKRSIVGTRVCAPGTDGIWYSGKIEFVKTAADQKPEGGAAGTGGSVIPGLTTPARYTVLFDNTTDVAGLGLAREFRETELIGPGFRTIADVKLKPGQKVFLTYNGRENAGEVITHDDTKDEVKVRITVGSTNAGAQEAPIELTKRLEEVRLLESRRSLRLAVQEKDTDFARLADMAGDRRRQSSSIDVPFSLTQQNGSRKRRPSYSQDDREYFSINDDDPMDECNAALVLMSLSCSPNSSAHGYDTLLGTSSGSSTTSWSTGSTSPPLSEDGHSTPPTHHHHHELNHHHHHHHHTSNHHNGRHQAVGEIVRGARTTSLSTSDEGIGMEYNEDMPRKRRASQRIFKCTWKGCGLNYSTCAEITSHVRNAHLGPRKPNEYSDEEDFFFTETEDESDESAPNPPSPPTLSHRDMARPPHEDPEYQRQIVGNYRQGLLSQTQALQQHAAAAAHQQQQQQQQQQQLQAQQLASIKPPLPAGLTVAALSSNGASSSASSASSNGTGSSNGSTNGTSNTHSSVSPLIHHNYTWSQVSPTSPQKHVRLSPRPSASYPYPSPNYQHHYQAQAAQQQQQHHQQQLGHIQLSPGSGSATGTSGTAAYHQLLAGAAAASAGAVSLGSYSTSSSSSAGSVGSGGQHRSPVSPNRRTRGENKKCRKVYGMDHKDQWCTQCKWKKACSRFGD
ncbi:zinc finger protein 395-like [Anopheles coustani]|uniref:zinc finger protein 395-like n=2 Tax=coustani group TaxID=59130 RepID=UPI002659F573|nr:zinc finger protein 395-like [Anopheles coustani]